jgi:tRNA(fMet)-specific endonuclease VapC
VIILDTQHISQLQLLGSLSESLLSSRLKTIRSEDLRITIISPFEQLRECLGRINARSSRPAEQVMNFELLLQLLDFYSSWTRRILLFDQTAAQVFSQFSPQLIRRIGPRDSRIAAIALAHNATLLSSNLRDFSQVPGLLVEDWLRV